MRRIVPVIVAALVNDTVGVIHAVSDEATKAHADLADQLRRAAQSVLHDVAEGCGWSWPC
jgi:four helix bundle protein